MPNINGLQDNPVAGDPARYGASVTPNDTADLPTQARGLYVGTGGNVTLVTYGGSTILLKNVVASSILPITAKRVMSTGTTAADIVALW